MSVSDETEADDVLSQCDREPIRIPGSVQPHGCLVALREPDLTVTQASENAAEVLGKPFERPTGRPLRDLIGAELAEAVRDDVARLVRSYGGPRHLRTFVAPSGRRLNVVGHRHDEVLILEFEPAEGSAPESFANVHSLTSEFVAGMQAAGEIAEVTQFAALEVRRLTGFDRVLVYRFDSDGHGTVLAEDRNDVFPSYLGHRFPASDVPRQARDLYRVNRLRLIADAGYRPVPISPAENPVTGRPLDLTFSTLRSVSPVHVEYMKNMGTAASMSISIVRDGELWGLISCHHATPRTVPFTVRAACDFVGQVLSLRLDAAERAEEYERRIRLKAIQGRLLAALAGEADYRDGFARRSEDLLAFATAGGAAVVTEEGCILIGETPSEPEVREIIDWLARTPRGDVFHSESLHREHPPAAAYADRASGLLAVSISKLYSSYLLWFRPETPRSVIWAGDPRKAASAGGGHLRLHPRKSFEMWRETLRGTAAPFRASEVEAAAEFRNAVLGIVLRKAEEMARLAGELERSNKELEAFSYSVSHDLRAPFRHIVGYSELLKDHAAAKLDTEERRYLDAISDSASQAGLLVDNLLAYSRMGPTKLDVRPGEMADLVEEARQEAMLDATGRDIAWRIGDLPRVECDPIMVRLAVQNLLGNAIKYTRPRKRAVIEVGATDNGPDYDFYVRDNGIGFDMAYADKLFGVFQRLHRMEDFEGTGIGLANVRRVISRHGGRTWADAAVDRGATFHFTLPKSAGGEPE